MNVRKSGKLEISHLEYYRGLYSYRIYHQIKSIFGKKIFHLYHTIDADGVYNRVHYGQR